MKLLAALFPLGIAFSLLIPSTFYNRNPALDRVSRLSISESELSPVIWVGKRDLLENVERDQNGNYVGDEAPIGGSVPETGKAPDPPQNGQLPQTGSGPQNGQLPQTGFGPQNGQNPSDSASVPQNGQNSLEKDSNVEKGQNPPQKDPSLDPSIPNVPLENVVPGDGPTILGKGEQCETETSSKPEKDSKDSEKSESDEFEKEKSEKDQSEKKKSETDNPDSDSSESDKSETELDSFPDGDFCDPKTARAIHGKQLRDLLRFYATQSLKTKQEMILLYLRLVERLVVRKLNKKAEYISQWDFDEFEKGRAKYIKKKISKFLRSKTGSLLDKVTIPFSLSIRVLSGIADYIRSGKKIDSLSFSDEVILGQLCDHLAWCPEQTSAREPATLSTLKSYRMYSVFDKLFGRYTQDAAEPELGKRATDDNDEDPFTYSFQRIDTKYSDPESELKRVFKATARSPTYTEVYDSSVRTKRDDCVPVTWYNVFHHSIFGKPKFCHT